MVSDRVFFARLRKRLTALLVLTVALINGPVSLSAQSDITPDEIRAFAELLINQPTAAPLDLKDLTDQDVAIHWLYPDRRAARTFLHRISSYFSTQRVRVRYHWDWPEKMEVLPNQITIVVYGTEMEMPDRIGGSGMYKIRLGSGEEAGTGNIWLPEATKAYLDLAGQFLMGGIVLDENGNIRTGSRVSFLPAGYFGLDGKFIEQQLDSILQMGLDSAAFPGAVVSLAYKGSVIYEKAVGYHTYNRVYRDRVDDLFDLASVTKVTAGVNGLMTMYEDGQFDLEKNLGDYFEYFKNTEKGNLSLKRILTHSAGLTPYLVYYNMALKDNGRYVSNTISASPHDHFNYAVTDSIFVSDRFNRFIYKAIKESPLKPGNKYEYSGLFFLLIPDLVEGETGSTLDQYLADRVFGPLGAYNTSFNPSWNHNIHQIIPTEVDHVWRHQLVHGSVHDEASAVLGGVSANAGLFSTAPDLIRIGETWRRNGQYGGNRYWSPETIRTFTQCIYCDEGNRRSLGFDRPPLPEHDYVSYMSPMASQESFGHSGFTGTMIWVDPKAEYTFVFLSNRVNPTRENSKLYTLNIRPDLHSVLYKALERSRHHPSR